MEINNFIIDAFITSYSLNIQIKLFYMVLSLKEMYHVQEIKLFKYLWYWDGNTFIIINFVRI